MSTFANSGDPYEMQHNAAFPQRLHVMLKKHVISYNIVTVLKASVKGTLADVNCYCKMTSVVALDGVKSFLCLKYATYSCKHMPHRGFLQCNGGKLEEAADFKGVYVVYCVLESK